MPDRLLIAAIVYPVCQSVLMGTGIVAAATMLPGLSNPVTSLVQVGLASVVLALPLSWALVPHLLSVRERRDL